MAYSGKDIDNTGDMEQIHQIASATLLGDFCHTRHEISEDLVTV